MDTKNLRSNASRGKRKMDTTYWRNQLPPDTRKKMQKMLSDLMNTLRQQDHISGDEGLNKLVNTTDIEQIEEKIYTAASSQRDYLKRITSEMIAIEKKSLSSKKITTDVPKNQVQRYHPLHEHPLIRFKHTAHETEEKKYCYACREVLDGLYFGCEQQYCQFWLHEWCLEKPSEIPHPRHPHHHLTLYKRGIILRRIICDECLCDPEGLYYSCLHCGFMLHFQCAFLTINEPRRSQHIKESFRHVAHRHELILYNQVRDIYESPRFVRKRSGTTQQSILICCQWCTKPVLSGRTYACVRCELYFHQACAFMEVPFKIQHHSHKPHILRLGLTDYESLYDDDDDDEEKTTCRSCKRIGGLSYTCEKCKWGIHGKCSTLLPSFKSKYHDHDLIYFEKEDYGGMDFSCHKCGGIDDSQNNNFDGFYRCIECDVNFHLSCILSVTVKHKYHWHSLTLMNSTKNDSDDQYYCDICETERNPNHSVYACKECDYCVAHIECALNQERKNELLTKGPSVVLRHMEVKPDLSTATTAVKKWTNWANVEMHHPFHDHFLCLDTPRSYHKCRGCGKYFAGIAFTCKSCEDFALHERCAEFPLELLNFPLHSHHPPLVLKFFDYDQFSSPSFRCDVCGKVRDGFCFRYQCTQCNNFFVDTKCASLSTPTLSHQHKNKMAKHFSHQHQLHLVPCGAKEAVRCQYCGSKVEGLGYRCMETTCWFHLHESCLTQIPRQLKQLHFHLSHSLVFSRNPTLRCNICGLRLKCLGYDCSECGADISVHSVCALFQRRTLKSSHHDHALYYFGRDINLLFKHLLEFDYYYFDDKVWFKCERCGGSCSRAFYRCLECDINFHLECIPIPRVVKSKCHRHHVKLVDSFVVEGYDLDDQYCDVCEEKRDPRDHAYYCDRCSDPFVGHVDCVLYKIRQIIEEAKQGPSHPCCNHLDSTDDEKVFGNQHFMVKIEKEISISSVRKNDYARFVDFHPTKPWLVTLDKFNSVKIWSHETEELQSEKSFKAKYSASKFIEQENWIVIGDERGYIYIYNYETSKKIDKFKAHDSSVKCLAVHSSRSYLLSSGDRFVIRLWDWKKKKGTWLCIKEFVDHCPTLNPRYYSPHVQVAFNPKDLNTFASIGDDGNLMIWNINSSDPVRVIRVHPKDEKNKEDFTYIRSIEFFIHVDKQYLLAYFSSDKQSLLPSFQGGLIKIWEYTQEDYGHHQDLTTAPLCLAPKLPIQILWSYKDETVDICIDAINYRCKLEEKIYFGPLNFFAWGKSSNRMVLLWDNAALMVKVTRHPTGMGKKFLPLDSFAWGKSSNRMVLMGGAKALMLKVTSPEDGEIGPSRDTEIQECKEEVSDKDIE